MEKTDINQLALKIVDAMLDAGFTNYTAWNEYECSFKVIVRLHRKMGFHEFNHEAINAYDSLVEQRYNNSEISYSHYRRLKHSTARMIQFYTNGRIEWSTKIVKDRLPEYYETLLNEILINEGMGEKAFNKTWGYSRRFFSWLVQEGYHDLKNVTVEVLQRYLICCSQRLSSQSLKTIKCRLKKLFRYSAEKGWISNSYERFFSFNVSQIRKILPPASQDEIAVILSSIDRYETRGKRNYAILMLGVVLGLRACDVSNLRLSSIDWRKGEINIFQKKTKRSLSLPLTKDVGEAIRDYILNGRPQTDSEYVFLTLKAPTRSLADGSISSVYASCRKGAGFPHEKNQGFHSLRRAVGLSMVTNGVPVTTVAQVLGHSDIDSTKQYIALDSRHLKDCALNLSGIEMKEEAI